MLNLLRRSKNKRTQRQDPEDSSADNPANAFSQKPIPKPQPKPKPPQRRMLGKFTATAIDALEDFNDLEEMPSSPPPKAMLENQQTANAEREANFAKIYFEDTELIRNVNLAAAAKTQKIPATALTVAKKFVSLVGGSGSLVGGGGAHLAENDEDDVLNSAETKQNSAEKYKTKAKTTTTTTATRKSLGFRKVDLDGVNSVIEAILPYDDNGVAEDVDVDVDVDGECSDQQKLAKNTQTDSELSNVKRRSLSQNERAELSGHVSSPSQPQWLLSTADQQQILYDIIDQTSSSSNVSKNNAKAQFNSNREKLATKSNGAGNARSSSSNSNSSQSTTDQNEPLGLNNTANTNTNNNIVTVIDANANAAGIASHQLVSSEVPSNNSKQIKAARRRSYFQRKNSNSESETSTAPPQQPTAEVAQKFEEKKAQGPLQKGKKLLTEIFMARGRNHSNQRNRNQSQQSQQSQQQSKQEPSVNNSKSKSNAAVTLDHNTCPNTFANKDKTTISETRNNFTANNRNKHIDRAAEPPTTTMLRRHLESSNSAGSYRDPAATTTNQMTFANNSGKNASSRRDVYDVSGVQPQQQQQQWRSQVRGNGLTSSHQRSNSAEHRREQRETARNSTTDDLSKYYRAYSEEPERPERRRWSGALRDFVRIPIGKEHQPSTASAAKLTRQPSVIRASITEQYGRTKAEEIFGKQSNAQNHNKTQAATTTTSAQLHQRHGRESSIDRKSFGTDAVNSMGQSYGKNEPGAEESRASTPREFRESQIPETGKVPLPKITVIDCSAAAAAGTKANNNDQSAAAVEHEIFYEFENEHASTTNSNAKDNSGVEIEDLDSDIDDEVFHEQVSNSQPTQFTTYRHQTPMRHSPTTFLEDVPEEQDDEDEGNGGRENANAKHAKVNDIDNEFLRRSRSRLANSASMSPERGPLKSCDSNLSNSYPDSGISGCSESLFDSLSPESNNLTTTTSTNKTTNNTATIKNSTTARSSLPQRRQRSPFVRDSTSTDCDDTLLQCDDLDCFASPSTSTTTVISGGGERLVCIESISLPDVVESTTSSSPGGVTGQNVNNASTASASAAAGAAAGSGGAFGNAGGEQIININGATGNSMGNVHFIPIHIEGGAGGGGGGCGERSRGGSITRENSPQKRRSIDDNVIGSGLKGSRLSHLNGDFDCASKPTIEIVEDDDNVTMDCQAKFNNFNDFKSEKLRLELQEQKSRFSAQLEDAHKNVQNLQTKINNMQTKIVNLEQELSTKTWNVERLQSELNATQREDEFVRKKLRLLEEEKTDLRRKYDESEDEYRKKYEELEIEYKELEDKYKNTQKLASELQVQLARAQSEAEKWRSEVEAIRADLEEQIRILQNSYENSEAERKICEDKWQKEFEMLRTQTMEREETLMTDCEWQLRQMQKQWKDKLDKSENGRRDAVDTAELMGMELEARKQEVENLRHCETEVKCLRGVVSEQQNSIETLMEQIETLKTELHKANEKLEDQIEAVKKIKYQCDNTLCDKERQMIYRIDEVRNEAASFWENKLHTEMTRLTHELESVYVDERRDALDKLQAEHIEELRALTTRYTANEEELRAELTELQERYNTKSQEFLDLRNKSDNALLQTRMHLDRADREYQNAMCREEERREALEESLRKEFEEVKEEMEQKFRERIEKIKEELKKELKETKQEMTLKHQKDLEQQKAKLLAEKNEALHDLAERHRTKLAAAEEQIKEAELRHQRDLHELKVTYDEDKAILDKRDLSNANEIEQLHRRCRCLTNLFEEMRMRYERRDPRPEDLREIEELRTRCDSQERDLFTLTASLRELQMQMSNLQQNPETKSSKKNGKTIQKPPPKTIPTSCDVIYEDENEERESPSPPPPPEPLKPQKNGNDSAAESSEDDEEEDDDASVEADNEDEVEAKGGGGAPSFNSNNNKMVNGSVSQVH